MMWNAGSHNALGVDISYRTGEEKRKEKKKHTSIRPWYDNNYVQRATIVPNKLR